VDPFLILIDNRVTPSSPTSLIGVK
jgi:hypothetical protein